MREIEVKLGDKTLTLQATFKSALEIAEKVADPIMIAREAVLEQIMVERGLTYNPKWSFTIKNIPVILYTGVKAAGGSETMEEVQEMVFEAGFGEARDAASEYLGIIVGPKSEIEVEPAKKGEKSGK